MAFLVPVITAIGTAATAGAATGTTAAVIGGSALAFGATKAGLEIANLGSNEAPLGTSSVSTRGITRRAEQLRLRALERSQDRFSREDTVLTGQESLGNPSGGKTLLGG